jgi:hypothetical protein
MTLFRLLGLIRSLWGVLVFSIMMRTFEQACGIALLTLGAWGIGQVIEGASASRLGWIVVTLVLLGSAATFDQGPDNVSHRAPAIDGGECR